MTTRGWQEPADLAEPEGPRGRIEKLIWSSEIVGYEGEVQVYLPPGYDEGDERLGLLVVHGGDEALARGLISNTLDHVIGKTVAPLVFAFVPQAHRRASPSGIAEYSRALGEELVPLLDESFRTLARPDARGLMGAGRDAGFSIYAVFERPGVFGKLALQFLFMLDLRDDVSELIETSLPQELDIYIDWSRHDFKNGPRIDVENESKQVVEALETRDYQPITHEEVGGSGWGAWRQRTSRILEILFPLE